MQESSPSRLEAALFSDCGKSLRQIKKEVVLK